MDDLIVTLIEIFISQHQLADVTIGYTFYVQVLISQVLLPSMYLFCNPESERAAVKKQILWLRPQCRMYNLTRNYAALPKPGGLPNNL